MNSEQKYRSWYRQVCIQLTRTPSAKREELWDFSETFEAYPDFMEKIFPPRYWECLKSFREDIEASKPKDRFLLWDFSRIADVKIRTAESWLYLDVTPKFWNQDNLVEAWACLRELPLPKEKVRPTHVDWLRALGAD